MDPLESSSMPRVSCRNSVNSENENADMEIIYIHSLQHNITFWSTAQSWAKTVLSFWWYMGLDYRQVSSHLGSLSLPSAPCVFPAFLFLIHLLHLSGFPFFGLCLLCSPSWSQTHGLSASAYCVLQLINTCHPLQFPVILRLITSTILLLLFFSPSSQTHPQPLTV